MSDFDKLSELPKSMLNKGGTIDGKLLVSPIGEFEKIEDKRKLLGDMFDEQLKDNALPIVGPFVV